MYAYIYIYIAVSTCARRLQLGVGHRAEGRIGVPVLFRV